MAYQLGLILLALAAMMALILGTWMTSMPGHSIEPPLPALSEEEQATARQLQEDVLVLADRIGERNMRTPEALADTADYIAGRLEAMGYTPRREEYIPGQQERVGAEALTAENVIVELSGTQRPEEVVVVGAHYDTVPGSPGANDNASGVAVLLALAEAFANRPQSRTIRFVAFTNEEAPYFMTPDMGSYRHAHQARAAGEDIRAMMSMDGVGYFSDEPGSQHFPVPGIDLIYPDQGNFIGFVTRLGDRQLLFDALAAFRGQATAPSEGAVLPAGIPGVGWSDHWSFWQHDYAAFLVTDTLPFRDPHYHTPEDTPERLDYERMARVAVGLRAVVRTLSE